MAQERRQRSSEVAKAFYARQLAYRRALLESEGVRQNPRLFVLGFVLSERFDWESFDCFPKRETMAKEVGVSPTQVTSLLKDLVQMGFIRIKRRRNESSVYAGTIPQEVKCSSLPDRSPNGELGRSEVKSSRSRKSTGLNIRKSSGLSPNDTSNDALNDGGSALQAEPAPDLQQKDKTRRPLKKQTVLVGGHEGRPVVVKANPELPVSLDMDDIRGSLTRASPSSPIAYKEDDWFDLDTFLIDEGVDRHVCDRLSDLHRYERLTPEMIFEAIRRSKNAA